MDQVALQDYLNKLFACDRLLFSPLVRTFFKFDLGQRTFLRDKFATLNNTTLQAYGNEDYWK